MDVILIPKDSTGKMAFWLLKLQEFKLDIEHRSGIKHRAADAVFRLRITGGTRSRLETTTAHCVSPSPISEKEEARLLYMQDEHAKSDK